MPAPKRGKEALLEWCKQQTAKCKQANVKNFSTSWKDGWAFCAIINNYRPNICKLTGLDKKTNHERLEYAFKCAEKIGIESILKVEDVDKEKEGAIVTYVSKYFYTFKDETPGKEAPARGGGNIKALGQGLALGGGGPGPRPSGGGGGAAGGNRAKVSALASGLKFNPAMMMPGGMPPMRLRGAGGGGPKVVVGSDGPITSGPTTPDLKPMAPGRLTHATRDRARVGKRRPPTRAGRSSHIAGASSGSASPAARAPSKAAPSKPAPSKPTPPPSTSKPKQPSAAEKKAKEEAEKKAKELLMKEKRFNESMKQLMGSILPDVEAQFAELLGLEMVIAVDAATFDLPDIDQKVKAVETLTLDEGALVFHTLGAVMQELIDSGELTLEAVQMIPGGFHEINIAAMKWSGKKPVPKAKVSVDPNEGVLHYDAPFGAGEEACLSSEELTVLITKAMKPMMDKVRKARADEERRVEEERKKREEKERRKQEEEERRKEEEEQRLLEEAEAERRMLEEAAMKRLEEKKREEEAKKEEAERKKREEEEKKRKEAEDKKRAEEEEKRRKEEEAERKRLEEEERRLREEEEERVRREEEAARKRLEEERKKREAEEKKRKEEEERKRKEEEERRKKEEAERKRREEEERKKREEEERKRKEEEEKRKKEEEERKRKEEEERKRQEEEERKMKAEEERKRKEEEARIMKERDERKRKEALDKLRLAADKMKKEAEERKKKAEAERAQREEAEKKRREEEERKRKEEEEKKKKEEEERKRKEEEERKRREEEEKKRKDEEEKKRKEEEERRKKEEDERVKKEFEAAEALRKKVEEDRKKREEERKKKEEAARKQREEEDKKRRAQEEEERQKREAEEKKRKEEEDAARIKKEAEEKKKKEEEEEAKKAAAAASSSKGVSIQEPVISKGVSIQEPAKSAPAKKVPSSTSKFGSKDRCSVCDKRVYFNEMLKADNDVYHKNCFRCDHCNKVLGVGTYAALQGKVYCKPHFKQLFLSKGNYSSGFGGVDPKAKWANNSGGSLKAPTEKPSPGVSKGSGLKPGGAAKPSRPARPDSIMPSSSGSGTAAKPASGSKTAAKPTSGSGTATKPASGSGTAAKPTSGSGTAAKPASGSKTAAKPASGSGTATKPASGSGTAAKPASGSGTAAKSTPSRPQRPSYMRTTSSSSSSPAPSPSSTPASAKAKPSASAKPKAAGKAKPNWMEEARRRKQERLQKEEELRKERQQKWANRQSVVASEDKKTTPGKQESIGSETAAAAAEWQDLARKREEERQMKKMLRESSMLPTPKLKEDIKLAKQMSQSENDSKAQGGSGSGGQPKKPAVKEKNISSAVATWMGDQEEQPKVSKIKSPRGGKAAPPGKKALPKKSKPSSASANPLSPRGKGGLFSTKKSKSSDFSADTLPEKKEEEDVPPLDDAIDGSTDPEEVRGNFSATDALTLKVVAGRHTMSLKVAPWKTIGQLKEAIKARVKRGKEGWPENWSYIDLTHYELCWRCPVINNEQVWLTGMDTALAEYGIFEDDVVEFAFDEDAVDLSQVKPTELEGYLQMQGGNNWKWQNRFCSTEDNRLFYFKNENSKIPLGFIPLGPRTNIERSELSEHAKDSVFRVETQHSTHYFQTECPEDEETWRLSLNQTKNYFTKYCHECTNWKDGYVMKRSGGLRKTWSRKFFVLRNEFLWMYELLDGVYTLSGKIAVYKVQAVADKDTKEGFPFKIISGKKAILCMVESKEDRSDWINAIKGQAAEMEAQIDQIEI